MGRRWVNYKQGYKPVRVKSRFIEKLTFRSNNKQGTKQGYRIDRVRGRHIQGMVRVKSRFSRSGSRIG